MRLTAATIADLSLPAGKSEIIVFDDAMPGFGVRLRAGGKKTFIVQYRVGKQQRRVTIASTDVMGVADARKAARQMLGQVASMDDPQVEKARKRRDANLTLGALVDDYLEYKKQKLRPRSFDQAERALRERWSPLHGLPMSAIDPMTISARLDGLSKEYGPASADRARAELSSFFTWAIKKRAAARENPVTLTERPADPKARDRVLTDAELREVWQAAGEEDYGRIVRLLILTGQRREEVAAMTWSELDAARAVWSLPRDRTKNKLPHDVPMSDQALDIIRSTPARAGRDLLFGVGKGPFSGWSRGKKGIDRRLLKARQRALTEAGLDPANAVPPPPWTIHDLRRTLVTGMAERGVLPHVVEAVVNHISGTKAGVAGIYNRATYAAEKRAAMVLWGDHVQSLVAGASHTVIPLRRA